MLNNFASKGGVATRLRSTFTALISSLLVFGLVVGHAPAPAQAKNNGLGAAAVGLAAGLVIGGALSNAAKSKPKPQKTYKKKPKYKKKKTYTKKKSKSKKTYSKKKTSPKRKY
ncbi:MAG: hypothetical protein AAFO75_11585, partial [Pseudomonadota bacterium]